MAFDFPSSPTVGQIFTPSGGPTYTWNGYAWTLPAIYVAKAGDTMTGFLTLDYANPTFALKKGASGENANIYGMKGAAARWGITLGDSSAEGGSNAGSNFVIGRYTDGGALIDNPLTITRSTGAVLFGQIPTAPTPAANSNDQSVATTAFVQAAQAQLPTCGQLRLATSTSLIFAPYNGNKIFINGTTYTIPSGGVTSGLTGVRINGVAGQNLAASTVYWVYLFNNAGTLTFDFYTTAGHGPDSTYGSECKTGDASRAFVGLIFTGSGVFAQVRSWFNRYPNQIPAAGLSNFSTTATSMTNYVGNISPFINLANERIEIISRGIYWNNQSGQYGQMQYTLDAGVGGANIIISTCQGLFPLNETPVPTVRADFAEGLHQLFFNAVSSVASNTFSLANMSVAVMVG